MNVVAVTFSTDRRIPTECGGIFFYLHFLPTDAFLRNAIQTPYLNIGVVLDNVGPGCGASVGAAVKYPGDGCKPDDGGILEGGKPGVGTVFGGDTTDEVIPDGDMPGGDMFDGDKYDGVVPDGGKFDGMGKSRSCDISTGSGAKVGAPPVTGWRDMPL